MIRIGAITHITDEVFDYLLFNYPNKRPAINNLKGLQTIISNKTCEKSRRGETTQRRVPQVHCGTRTIQVGTRRHRRRESPI